MEKGKSLSVGLLVELTEGRRQVLTHEENSRLHGVGYSTSKYAQRWCEKMRRTTDSGGRKRQPTADSGSTEKCLSDGFAICRLCAPSWNTGSTKSLSFDMSN